MEFEEKKETLITTFETFLRLLKEAKSEEELKTTLDKVLSIFAFVL